MILVEVELDRCGNIIGRPVSDRWHRRFAKIVKANGFDADDGFFFQQGFGAQEFLTDVPTRHRKDLEKGWSVRFKVDPWIVGHWYGYDAHLAAE